MNGENPGPVVGPGAGVSSRAAPVLCPACRRVGPGGEPCRHCGAALEGVPDRPPAAPRCLACGHAGGLAGGRACPSCGLLLPGPPEDEAIPVPPGLRLGWLTGAAIALVGLAAVVAAAIVFGGGPPDLVPRWRLQAGSAVVGRPQVDGGDLFVATRAGSVVSVDAGSGQARWRFETGERVVAQPVVAEGLVFVSTEIPGSSEGKVFAVDTRTGTEQWRFPTVVAQVGAPVVAGGLVVLSAGDVVALDAASGQVRWRQTVAGAVALTAGPEVVVVTTTDGVRALDAATGGLGWSWATTGVPQAPVAVAGDLVVADDGAALVVGLDAADGSRRWQAPLGEDVGNAPAAAGSIAVVVTAGEVVALDVGSGERRWRYDVDGEDVEVATDGSLVARTAGGSIALLDALTGDVRGTAVIAAGLTAQPAVAGGRAYVASGDTVAAYDQAPP